uniref:Uncharacterized protein n=1 Tax=Arundo donax TaxID=35708 RepID=A0A0A9HRZ4_ARUDO
MYFLVISFMPLSFYSLAPIVCFIYT